MTAITAIIVHNPKPPVSNKTLRDRPLQVIVPHPNMLRSTVPPPRYTADAAVVPVWEPDSTALSGASAATAAVILDSPFACLTEKRNQCDHNTGDQSETDAIQQHTLDPLAPPQGIASGDRTENSASDHLSCQE